MANTKVTGGVIADGAITAAKIASGALDGILNTYLTTNTYATQSYVTTAVNNLIDAAPASLDTLNELAAALNDDANFATTVTNSLATKLNLSGGTLTGDLIVNAKIGIGTSSPSAAGSSYGALDIRGTGGGSIRYGVVDGFNMLTYATGSSVDYLTSSAADVRWFNKASFGESMRITSAGNVGIGTTDPKSALEIRGAFGAPATSGFASGFISRFSQTSGAGCLDVGFGDPYSWLQSRASNNYATNFALALNPNGGNVGIGTSSPTAKLDVNSGATNTVAAFRSTDAGAYIGMADPSTTLDAGYPTLSIGAVGNDLTLNTSNAEKVRVTSSGNVGIGTSSPQRRLTIGGGSISEILSIYGSSTGSSAIHFTDTNTITDFQGFVTYAHGQDALRFGTAETERMRITSGGNVAIGSTGSGYRLDVRNTSSGIFYGQTDATSGSLMRLRANAGASTILEVFADGSITIPGSLSKGSGSFKIDHPLEEKKDTHDLVHSFVESPQANNIYRGKVQLVNGVATVNLDEVSTMTEGTFVALNRDIHTYTSNESDWDAVRGKVEGNILTIECQNTSSTATVSWLVIGERQDKHMYDTGWTDENGKVIVEPEKTDINGTN